MTWKLTPITTPDAGLCTLADVKARRGITDTDNDTVLEQIIAAVTSAFETECRRPLLQTAAAVTEYYTGQGPYLQLDRYPIIAITSIKEASDYNFTDADALTSDEDYRLVRAGVKGILYSMLGDWDPNPDAIQIVYRGGFCPAGSAPATGETAVPDDLREAAILQSVWNFQRKDDLGLSMITGTGGSVSKSGSITLLDEVKRILDHYRKPSL